MNMNTLSALGVIVLAIIIGFLIFSSPQNNSMNELPAEGEDVTVSGEVICLPHKDTSGPQTLECAFGLRGDDGENYGLKNLENALVPDFPEDDRRYKSFPDTGSRIEVEGTFEAPEPANRYDIIGVIDVRAVRFLE